MPISTHTDNCKTMETIRTRLLEGNHCFKRCVSTKLFFPYHWVPGSIRMKASKLLFRSRILAARSGKNDLHNTSYVDNQTDHLIALLGLPAANGTSWQWPSGKKCALVLSHDTDSKGQKTGVRFMKMLAKDFNLVSTFAFVGDCMKHYRPLIEELRSAGHEIALHDATHDNRIAFKSVPEILNRLEPFMPMMRQYEIRGFRSPSWYTSEPLWTALEQLGFAYDMSVQDTWPLFDTARNYGTGSFFPFRVSQLVLVPNTVMFELPFYLSYPKEYTFDFWRPKLDRIAQAGGLIMFNAHPDRWFSGNKSAVTYLRKCVEYILTKYDPACLTAGLVQQHVMNELKRGAMRQIKGAPSVDIPQLGNLVPVPDPS